MKKVIVRVTKVSGTEYEGYVFSDDLSNVQLAKLGFIKGDIPTTVPCSGEFDYDMINGAVSVSPVSVVVHAGISNCYLDNADLNVDWTDLLYGIENKIDTYQFIQDLEANKWDRGE
jgi:hypothetical protein